jgi:hypothetical protein
VCFGEKIVVNRTKKNAFKNRERAQALKKTQNKMRTQHDRAHFDTPGLPAGPLDE